MTFITSNGITKTGEELKAALKTVAENKRELAEAIYVFDNYASHVTEQTKHDIMIESKKQADEIENGQCNLSHFWLWQLVNEVFTGEKVALLAK